MPMDNKQVQDFLYQALETELGGVKIYETALRCAQNKDLKSEWGEYLDQTRAHVQVLGKLFDTLGLDTTKSTDGRKVVGHIGRSLVTAISERDIIVVQNLVLFYALIFVAVNVLVDLSYAWLDPRIRYQ